MILKESMKMSGMIKGKNRVTLPTKSDIPGDVRFKHLVFYEILHLNKRIVRDVFAVRQIYRYAFLGKWST